MASLPGNQGFIIAQFRLVFKPLVKQEVMMSIFSSRQRGYNFTRPSSPLHKSFKPGGYDKSNPVQENYFDAHTSNRS
jgi:hypothetical protein